MADNRSKYASYEPPNKSQLDPREQRFMDLVEGAYPSVGPGLTTALPEYQSTQRPEMERIKRMSLPEDAPPEPEWRDTIERTGPDASEFDRRIRELENEAKRRRAEALAEDRAFEERLAAIQRGERSPATARPGLENTQRAMAAAERPPSGPRMVGVGSVTPIRPGLRPAGVGQDDYLAAREQYPRMVDATERATLEGYKNRREMDALDQPTARTTMSADAALAELSRLDKRYNEIMGHLPDSEASKIYRELGAEDEKFQRQLADAVGRPRASTGAVASRGR